MSANLNALRETVRLLLGDTNPLKYTFPDTQVDSWINQAIRELSVHFPRTIEHTLSTTAGEREYEIDAVVLSILSVEYDRGGQDPPQYLTRRACTHPRFWQEDGYYDFIKPRDSDTANKPRLLISTRPAADGLVIALRIQTGHNELSAGSDECTLEERHLPLVSLHVRWQAWLELSMNEGMNPGPLATLSYSQEMNAGRAERAYRLALKEAQQAEGESAAAVWTLDRFDRLY